ncbi:uncharacterized protein RHO17_019352 isoform 2-T2 [Thomomys bottae]
MPTRNPSGQPPTTGTPWPAPHGSRTLVPPRGNQGPSGVQGRGRGPPGPAVRLGSFYINRRVDPTSQSWTRKKSINCRTRELREENPLPGLRVDSLRKSICQDLEIDKSKAEKGNMTTQK